MGSGKFVSREGLQTVYQEMNRMTAIFSILSFVVCISMTSASGRCKQPHGVVGRCKDSMLKFTYNQKTGKCERFIYGGCGGNKNRFSTKEECQRTCQSTLPGRCKQPHGVVGICKASMPKFTYNQKTGKCENFIYGGCGGNENRFSTKEECQRKCQTTLEGKCKQMPGVVGHCRGSFPNYTYYPKRGKCEMFHYGGCGGNANRFPTLTACQKKCART